MILPRATIPSWSPGEKPDSFSTPKRTTEQHMSRSENVRQQRRARRKKKRETANQIENRTGKKAGAKRRSTLNRGLCIDWLYNSGHAKSRQRSMKSADLVKLLIEFFPFDRPSSAVAKMQRGGIIALSADLIQKRGLLSLSETQMPPRADREHVYFVGDKDKKVVKIGMAKDVKRRCASLQVGFPAQLCVLHIIKNGGKALERSLHDRFKEYNSIGEWFFVRGALAEYLSDRTPIPYQSF